MYWVQGLAFVIIGLLAVIGMIVWISKIEGT